MESNVLQAVMRWQQHVWPVLGVAGPVALGLTLSGVKGSKVLPLSSWNLFPGDHKAFDRDMVMIPGLLVQDLATSAPAMLPTAPRLMWNGGGWSRSPSYSGPAVLRQG